MIAATRPNIGTPQPRSLHISLWALLSLAPLAAFAMPLWRSVLADTPTAYLVWIPVLSIVWGAYSINRTTQPADDAELNAILGVSLLGLVGAALVIGAARWPYLFLMQDAGLLLWPLWVLGMAWLLFGIGVTRALIWPLIYLLACWPPVLSAVATVTQGKLVAIAVAATVRASHLLPWLIAQGASSTFLVAHGTSIVPVLISEACSGADGALGAAILLPFLLTQFTGAAWRKGLVVLAALGGAVLFNLLRLGAIIYALHYFGANFALGVLHPVLGFALFALLAVCLVSTAGWVGLAPRAPIAGRPPVAGRGRIATSWLIGGALFLSLWPIFSTPYGAPGKPLAVKTSSVAALLPRMAGFRLASTQRYNDASILGPGAVSVAGTYVAPGGAAVLAEVWATRNLGDLQSYGFRNCLMFHGERLNALRVFDVAPRAPAADYALELPPNAVGGTWTRYEDIEWESAVQLPGGAVEYLRYAVAALPQGAGTWPASLEAARAPQPASGISAISMPPPYGTWPGDLQTTRTGLERFAANLATSLAQQDGRSAVSAAAVN